MKLTRLIYEIEQMKQALETFDQFSSEFVIRTEGGTLMSFTGWQMVDYQGQKGIVFDVAPL